MYLAGLPNTKYVFGEPSQYYKCSWRSPPPALNMYSESFIPSTKYGNDFFLRYGTEPGAPLVPYYGTSLRAILWNKARAIPSGRYGTSLRSILWNKCRSIPCAIKRLSSPAAIFLPCHIIPSQSRAILTERNGES